MTGFLSNPVVVVVLVAAIVAAGLWFAVRKAFTLGSGTGGVVAPPKTPPNPIGQMRPKPPQPPPPPPKDQV